MNPQEYIHAALHTLAPGLTQNERLGLCGLGLSGEIGEVTDLLKKYLYHRNGKPLDTEKLKDELGDVLWYYAVLLDTLDLTFEEVIATNVAKMAKRHPNGFCPQYSSDSHASEVLQ
jgi:NTP pyrophosphatase (non-canonical NTP hydrolase)